MLIVSRPAHRKPRNVADFWEWMTPVCLRRTYANYSSSVIAGGVIPALERSEGSFTYGCGPQGAAFNNFTSWLITRGRNLTANPSMKAGSAKTAAQ